VDPVLYAVMTKDLKARSKVNRLLKYADDTTLLVPSDSDVHLEDLTMSNSGLKII